jgi:hypothetical protein
MNKSREVSFKPVEKVTRTSAGPEWQPDLHEGPFHPARFILGKTLHHPVEQRVRGLKPRGQKMFEPILDFAGKEGWQHFSKKG